MFLEMSRDEVHGGGTWAFTNCLWSPTLKRPNKSGRQDRWAYWEKLLSVRAGDTVFHLQGKPPKAYFVGYSTASSDGFETTRRPPDPGEWAYAESFYRVDLTNYTPLHTPIHLDKVFAGKRQQLEVYFDANKSAIVKRNLFYVRQGGKLQCQNGAYLSDLDDELFEILFDTSGNVATEQRVTVQTAEQLRLAKARAGQSAFSNRIKDLYESRCCFPGCEVTDRRFLVGSHIARWSDNEALRGHLGNGLCFCTLHDRAFELGLFTLDEHYRVFVNPKERIESSFAASLLASHGRQIRLSEIKPLDDALLEHWYRVGISP
jgi:putative restriction endonuclease